MKAAKRKRAPGAGRKPQGEVSGLTSVMSFRMPKEMRGHLERAAKESGRSVTQETLRRLKWSFDEDRKNYRDPAIKALCFLFAELAESIHHGMPDWRSDPFLFRAFKIGVAKLLDNIPEPAGKIEGPPLLKALLRELIGPDDPMNETEFFRNWKERVTQIVESPEALAKAAVEQTLAAYFKPNQRYKNLEPWREKLDAMPDMPGIGSELLRHQENTYYGMEAARRDLSLKPRGRKS
jgi:Arc-like DNA binding dprotein